MKFKTPVFSELRGKLGSVLGKDDVCFRTYKNFGIQVIKNPARKVAPTDMQGLYRHQIYYWSLHWNFLTQEQKASYNLQGENVGITGYNYYLKEKYDPHYIYVHPSGANWTEKAYPDKISSPGESILMSDDETYEKNAYFQFPYNIALRTLDIIKAELHVLYYEEAGFDAEMKTIRCFMIVEPWDWRYITWNNVPDLMNIPVIHILMPGQGEWMIFDVTDQFTVARVNIFPFYGFKLGFHLLDPVTESETGIRSTRHHDNDFWPFLKIKIS